MPQNLHIPLVTFDRNKTLLLVIFFLFSLFRTYAIKHDVNSYSQLTTAITSASDGDTINFKEHIVVAAAISVSKSLVFQGNGYSISVPIPGLNDAGIYNTSPSSFRVFALSGAKTIVFNRLIIKGGNVSTGGGAITIATTTVAKFNNCTISNSRTTVGGGGIYNQGSCYLYETYITRNVANYGGGILNYGGQMFIEHSVITENRTAGSNGGGGIENQVSGSLYINNTSFSNNQCGGGAGALNNYGGKAVVCNTSFTGNIAFSTLKGGAVYQDCLADVANNTLTLVNCLFAYNYYATSGGYAAAAYALDDINAVKGNVYLYYCTYMANSSTTGTLNYMVGNNAHPLAGDGSTNDLFTGGSLSEPFDGTGIIQGTGKVFQPLLVNIKGQRIPTLKTASYALSKGCEVGFTNGSGIPISGYKNASTNVWSDLVGSGASAYAIPDDLTHLSRSAMRAVGAVETIVDNYIILKIVNSTGGTVAGASIYGEVYPSGTPISMTALPAAGYGFTNWTYKLGGTGTLSGNMLTITPTENTTLIPNFASTTNYTVTYLGNENTSGTVPAVATYSSGSNATIATNSGGLSKTGFTLDGWNTSANGSGTPYIEGTTYSSNTNLVLYARWTSLGQVLKVKLVNFSATPYKGGTAILVKWRTEEEMNNDHFDIERSANCGNNWEHVARVKGNGNSSVPLQYAITDEHPIYGQSCYRLKQVDKDGKTEYFPVVSVSLDKPKSTGLQLSPNPAKSVIKLQYSLSVNPNISIYNQVGHNVTPLCRIMSISSTIADIDISSLAPGYYIIKVGDEIEKFIKVNTN